MIQYIYSVYDNKALHYMRPFFARNKGDALRSFTEISNDLESMIGKYPDDFSLYELGFFDDSLGVFSLHVNPVVLGKAVEFKKVSSMAYAPELSQASGT